MPARTHANGRMRPSSRRLRPAMLGRQTRPAREPRQPRAPTLCRPGRSRRRATSRAPRRPAPRRLQPRRGPPGARRDNPCMTATAAATPARERGRERSYEELEAIFAGVDAPFALVDLDAMWANGRELLDRAQGTPIRVASKSVRCRSLLAAILERHGGPTGLRGLMTFTLSESLWLNGHGFDDLLLAYPTTDRAALAELAALESERAPIVMVDSAEHLDYIEAATGPGDRPIRRLHRPGRGLVAAGRATEGGRQALADPHSRAGAGARAPDRRPAALRAGRAHGLRGPHRRRGRPPARQAAAGTAHPPHEAPVGG